MCSNRKYYNYITIKLCVWKACVCVCVCVYVYVYKQLAISNYFLELTATKIL